MDNSLTLALSGNDCVFEYYNRLNCEDFLKYITIPSLFISSLDDPVCKPEFTPLGKLKMNKNIFTMVLSKGGHGQFLSTWKFKYHIFKVALEYFELFEKEIN